MSNYLILKKNRHIKKKFYSDKYLERDIGSQDVIIISIIKNGNLRQPI